MAHRRDKADVDEPQLSDQDDLFASPHQTQASKFSATSASQQKTPTNSSKARTNGLTPAEAADRDAALLAELESVRRINQVIEGVISSLDKAKSNMETVSRTVTHASTLLDTWTRILSQTEHNQRLILNPGWQGASQDAVDEQQEALTKQRERERRELEEVQRREAAEQRRAVEEEKRRLEAAVGGAPSGRGARGARGRATGATRGSRGTGIGSSVAGGGRAVGRGATSGYGRVGSVGTASRTTSTTSRGRGRGLG